MQNLECRMQNLDSATHAFHSAFIILHSAFPLVFRRYRTGDEQSHQEREDVCL